MLHRLPQEAASQALSVVKTTPPPNTVWPVESGLMLFADREHIVILQSATVKPDRRRHRLAKEVPRDSVSRSVPVPHIVKENMAPVTIVKSLIPVIPSVK